VKASEPLKSYYHDGGIVEQEPEEILRTVLVSVAACIREFEEGGRKVETLKICGISNQRETFIVWDKEGVPLHPAVVWQCKRSIDICRRLEADGLGDMIRTRTGLMIDPYFSGTKLIWLYENVGSVKKAIDNGTAYFGTVDTWLLYKLTNGRSYMTDYTNASRTLFFNLKSLTWDRELLDAFGLSRLNLPVTKPSCYAFGQTDFGGILKAPIEIGAMIGDSHAAAVGEGCFVPGTAKATMGTGCSMLMNTGSSVTSSKHGMVSTICWSMEGRLDYAVEGVIVSCGAVIEWLKNQLELFGDSSETETMAQSVPDNGGVFVIPAFSGLGAPYWQMDRKASIHGLTFATNKNHIVRAALEAVAFQIKDIVTAMEEDTSVSMSTLMVNGGMISNRFLLQLCVDLLDKSLGVKGIADVSAQGAAYLAGLTCGVFRDIDHVRKLIGIGITITPSGNADAIIRSHQQWQLAMVK
jgi:glycerol kinase